MRIEKISENGNGKGGKSELGAAEKFLFDIEDGQIRLVSILKMEDDSQASIEISEINAYGSDAVGTAGFAISMNRVFIFGELPLKAMGRKDKIVIQKLAVFDKDSYGKAEHREMGANHIETLRKELQKVKDEMAE